MPPVPPPGPPVLARSAAPPPPPPPAPATTFPPIAGDCSTSGGPRPCWPFCKPHDPGLASSQLRRYFLVRVLTEPGKRSQKGRVSWASCKSILTAFPLPEPVLQQAWHGSILRLRSVLKSPSL